MNAPARTAAVLRQPELADEVRVPGRPVPLTPAGERGRVHETDAIENGAQFGADHLSERVTVQASAQIAARAAAIDAAALEAEIERRAALVAESLIERQRAAWIAEAREEGYAHGVQSGREAMEREWAALVARAQPLLEAIKSASTRETQASAELALHLTFASLRKLLGEAFASNVGAQAAVANALAQTEVQSVVVVRVAPKDVALLAGASQGNGLLGMLPKDVVIEPDERIAPGGCVIETRRGVVDARIGSQLEQLLDAVREAYDARSVSPAAQEEAA